MSPRHPVIATFESLGGWSGVIEKLLGGEDLTSDEAAVALGQVLEGETTDAQLASFVTALRAKSVTVDEMSGFVLAMLSHAEPLTIAGELLDTCGTGGDRSRSVNVSTMAALVAAGAGARVCKHGNRSASSMSGSADVLEALGVAIDIGPVGVRRCVEEAGMGFCFARRFHPAMRHAGPVRSELGIATIFNVLGPLANPARVQYQVVGVSDPFMAEKMLRTLLRNGAKRALVVYGHDGLDELSTTGPSTVLRGAQVEGHVGAVHREEVDPASLGLAHASVADLVGGDSAHNAEVVRRVLGGERGPHRDVTVLNAAAALMVYGLATDMGEGIVQAERAIDDGRAAAVLTSLVAVSQEASAAGS
ncbi:MAG: anthranilate phosphoribosyltransferase [Acidimicrobiales bacterium]